VLLDDPLDLMAVVGTEDTGPMTWGTNTLVGIDGNHSYHVDPIEVGKLPDNACGLIDPEVTR
jgi:hypothetical protein